MPVELITKQVRERLIGLHVGDGRSAEDLQREGSGNGNVAFRVGDGDSGDGGRARVIRSGSKRQGAGITIRPENELRIADQTLFGGVSGEGGW